MIRLDNRLAAAASLVRLDKSICDVGTDHALLPCFLWQKGARRVIASDINDGPLEAAAETVNKYNCKGIELIKSDGLKSVPPCDDIIIAGMGGELISRIISECSFITPDTRLILQPMTKAEELRRWLLENGFEIILEKGAFAAGKAYSVIYSRYTGEKRTCDDNFAYFGKSEDEAYIRSVNARLKKLSKGNPELKNIIREEYENDC